MDGIPRHLRECPHSRQLNGRTMRLCAILRTPDPSTLARSVVCEIGRIRRKSRKNERGKKRLPSLPFLAENGGNPLWAVLNFFVEILS